MITDQTCFVARASFLVTTLYQGNPDWKCLYQDRKVNGHAFVISSVPFYYMVFSNLFYYKLINIYLMIFICNFKQLIKSLDFLTIPSEYIISLNKKLYV
jgi:hypothetical protein